MRGQHRILNEILIFAFGVAIASFVIISFGNMSNSIEKMTVEDQMNSVANMIRTGVIKVQSSNSLVRMELPDKISNNMYKIVMSGNNITIISYGKTEINITKQLFNMNKNYNISGEVVSTAGYVKIYRTGNNITISRVIRE